MENKTWTYADRYRHIKEVKIRHTEEKRIQQGGFMNADDYGNVPLPEDIPDQRSQFHSVSLKPVAKSRLGGEFCCYAGDSSHLCGPN